MAGGAGTRVRHRGDRLLGGTRVGASSRSRAAAMREARQLNRGGGQRPVASNAESGNNISTASIVGAVLAASSMPMMTAPIRWPRSTQLVQQPPVPLELPRGRVPYPNHVAVSELKSVRKALPQHVTRGMVECCGHSDVSIGMMLTPTVFLGACGTGGQPRGEAARDE